VNALGRRQAPRAEQIVSLPVFDFIISKMLWLRGRLRKAGQLLCNVMVAQLGELGDMRTGTSFSIEDQSASACQIAGGIVKALLRDLRCNCFALNGFPAISVNRAAWPFAFDFTISLHYAGESVSFQLKETDALNLANKKPCSAAVFELAQKAIAELERKVYDASRGTL
jgi:hypothetical protein